MEYVESEKLNVEFYMGDRESPFKTTEAGHPVVVPIEKVIIQIPGSQNTIIDTEVDDIYRKRFPVQYQKFKAGLSESEVSGWKLETWPAVNSAQVKSLKYLNIHTVEQLADLSDTSCQSVGMGTIELRVKAKAAIKAAAGNADTERQAVENQRLSDELQALREQIAAMSQDAAPAKRGVGRPPKE